MHNSTPFEQARGYILFLRQRKRKKGQIQCERNPKCGVLVPQAKDFTIQNTSWEIFSFTRAFLSLSTIHSGMEIFSLVTAVCATLSHEFDFLKAKFPLGPGLALDHSQETTGPNRSVPQTKSSLKWWRDNVTDEYTLTHYNNTMGFKIFAVAAIKVIFFSKMAAKSKLSILLMLSDNNFCPFIVFFTIHYLHIGRYFLIPSPDPPSSRHIDFTSVNASENPTCMWPISLQYGIMVWCSDAHVILHFCTDLQAKNMLLYNFHNQG